MAAFFIESGVSLYLSNSSRGLPLSPKESFTPTNLIGHGNFSERMLAILSPRPPITLCSSHVTTHFVLDTLFSIDLVSRGFIV